MSEFRVVDANGDPYPPHAQPCRTLEAAGPAWDAVDERAPDVPPAAGGGGA